MGWLDKTFKNIIKSPIGKAALLGGLYMTPWGQAAGTGIMSMLGKAGGSATGAKLASLWAKPIISKPLTSAATSYGLARLMRSRNPENAALWGALGTLPFLGTEASALAKAATKGGTKTSMWDVLLNKQINAPGYGKGAEALLGKSFDTLSKADKYRLAQLEGFKGLSPTQANIDKLARVRLAQGVPTVGAAKDLSYFMKDPTELAAMNKGTATGIAQFLPKSKFDIVNTMIPALGALYSAREYDDQKWDRIKRQRLEQLAFMYGVDPEDIKGEMDNPYYDTKPPALDWKYANQGGIMELPTGGEISGPGTGTSDSINAKVSNGEFIFTDKAIENLGGGDHTEGTKIAYSVMNQLDPQSQTAAEGMV
jgi:hypothetical protein